MRPKDKLPSPEANNCLKICKMCVKKVTLEDGKPTMQLAALPPPPLPSQRRGCRTCNSTWWANPLESHVLTPFFVVRPSCSTSLAMWMCFGKTALCHKSVSDWNSTVSTFNVKRTLVLSYTLRTLGVRMWTGLNWHWIVLSGETFVAVGSVEVSFFE